MLTRTAETAIQCLLYLARGPKGAMITPQKISKVLDTSTSYTAKILSSLSKAGILESKRGVDGGFLLNKTADQITVLDVYQACQDPGHTNYCKEVCASDVEKACGYHKAMLDIHLGFIERMEKWTLAEMLQSPSPSIEISPNCKSRWTHKHTVIEL